MQNTLNLYHIFYQVALSRNISGAAKELYISQPAISKSIKKLEDNLANCMKTPGYDRRVFPSTFVCVCHIVDGVASYASLEA